MSTLPQATYSFLPWVQGGIGRSIAAADEPGAALAARVTLPVIVHVDGAGDVPATVRLYGPGDVTGLDPAQIARCDPPPGTTRFEAGYMPQVQFARADLPWLFTPAAPGTAKTRLRPWLVLVAVRRQDGVRLVPNPGGPLPVLEIAAPADPAAELPDLSQSWAWAHAQIAGLGVGVRPSDMLMSDPGRACSRLLCPRRLQADTAYLACLVPAFLAGAKAGRGEPVTASDEASLEPAWSPTPAAPLRLPVYHAWEFATGSAGSFETLVRRLHPSPLDPASAQPPKLDLSAPGGGLPAAGVIGMQSALRVPGPDAPPPWPDATRTPFQAALERALTGAPADVLAPPVYGQLQAGASALPLAGGQPAWLREVNLDPRLRIAAAAGTRVVQDRQEQLMARAWEQAGAVNDANALLRRSQLARELGNVVMERHLSSLRAPDLLAMTQPAHAQIRLASATVDGELRASRVPEAVVSGAMRRLASPQGLIARRAVSAQPAPQPINMLAAVDQVAMTPPAPAPGGMVVMATLAAHLTAVDTRPALSADALRVQLLERLAPEKTVLERTRARIDAPAGTWTRPDPLAPVATGPRFADPMYEGLQQVAPSLFFPGVERVEADGVALLETTPRVIEAYMAGLNHELSRELLWREFPATLSGTAFRQFWDVSGQAGDPEALADIPPISQWGSAPLGGHLRGSGGQLVLLVRGELLRRYPTTTIYAARATAAGALDATTRLAPMFRGALPPDIVFVGFALSEESALGIDPVGPGWYFVFEEHPGEPRFGFDEVAGAGVPTTPDALAWAHVPLTASGHVDVARPLSAAANLQAIWGRNAAGMASLTFQQPFRVAMHASRLISRSG
ncbi:MAG TPA: hypothetical protein VKB80_18200 [Kofleriaceae bacterium]|nr:hypothetical protein [Kofleriaceae bacterium]